MLFCSENCQIQLLKYLIIWTSESGLAKQTNYDLPSTNIKELSNLVLETFYNESFELLRPSSVWSKAKQTNIDEFLAKFLKNTLKSHLIWTQSPWNFLPWIIWTSARGHPLSGQMQDKQINAISGYPKELGI